MPQTLPFHYQSSGFSEPGIFVELYLPKKAKFQGILHTTLTEGFNFELVTSHFLDKVKKPQIQKVLKHHSQWRSYSKQSIRSMAPFYWGYSMYEVDGVFYSNKTGANNTARIFEERTQVIRMMFLPDLDALRAQLDLKTIELRDILDIVKAYLRMSGHRRGQLGANMVHRSLIDRLADKGDEVVDKNIKNGNVNRILDFIEKWFDDVGLFLFGYVIFEICTELKELGDANEIDYEEEIWLTSFWNLDVNRVSYQKQRSRKELRK